MFSEFKITKINRIADCFYKEFVLQQKKYMLEYKKICVVTSQTV